MEQQDALLQILLDLGLGLHFGDKYSIYNHYIYIYIYNE